MSEQRLHDSLLSLANATIHAANTYSTSIAHVLSPRKLYPYTNYTTTNIHPTYYTNPPYYQHGNDNYYNQHENNFDIPNTTIRTNLPPFVTPPTDPQNTNTSIRRLNPEHPTLIPTHAIKRERDDEDKVCATIVCFSQ